MNMGQMMELNYRKFLPTLLLTFLISVFVLHTKIYAQFSGEKHVQTELVSEVLSIQPGQSFWVALNLKMDEHWHTYWLNPGDSGLPTSIEWSLPEGFTAGEIQWPYPEKILTPPLVSYGYHGEVLLLTKINSPENLTPGKDVTLSARVDWLECKEVCIPGDAEVSLTLPVSKDPPQPDEQWLEDFARTRADLPMTNSEWNFAATVDDENIIIQAQPPVWYDGKMTDMEFFPYESVLIEYNAEQELQKQGDTYRLKIKRAQMADKLPESLEGVMVAKEGWRGQDSEKAVYINIAISDNLPVSGNGFNSTLSSIWLAILFSFIGGMILNLMPCVLPVLSIKIMGFVQQAGEGRAKSFQHGLIFTAGVLVTFWVLAGALLILRAGGEQLGWGFQLQSPVFLIILSVFLFLFGLSMFGVFEIGTSLTTVGGKSQGKAGWLGSFVSGITATVVATPCTAPFMGSALGFALTQPVWASMAVFTSLGLGMAAPYVVLASSPALLKFVPKPGRWMESLKEFMGFLLLGTVVWLLWVLGIQAGATAVTIVLGALLIVGMAGWIYGRWGNLAMPGKTRIISSVIAVLLTIGALYFTLKGVDSYAVTPEMTTQSGQTEGIKWETFSDERLTSLVNAGQPVFLDFTAAWCLSCQVNEKVTFTSTDVQNKFSELNITALKADWTSRDQRITKALAQFGRNSVPLYVLYPGGAENEPVLLPELITPGILLEAFEEVGRK